MRNIFRTKSQIIDLQTKTERFASFILRVGIAIPFFYASISSFLDPAAWTGFIPVWLKAIIQPEIILYAHAVFEAFLGLWLLSGRKILYASIISALDILAILAFNPGALYITFRDIAIFFACIALAALSLKSK